MFKKIAFVLVALIATSVVLYQPSNNEESTSFHSWKAKHGISYASEI